MNWNLLTIDSAAPERYRHQMAASSLAEQRGARIVALTMPTLVGMNMSFGSYCALNLLPEWGPILSLPIPERIARLNDPATRASMERSAASPEAAPLGRVTGWSGYRIGDTYSSANEAVRGRLVADIARERGIGAFDALLDIVVADQLKTVLWPGPTDDDPESWRLRAEAWDSGYTMLGGSDAGAHLDRMFGAGYTTAFLGDCIRGKQLTSLENAVRHMTAVPAELFGLRDRGRLVEGSHADVVVFDPSVVDCGEVVLRRDLPGGASRLYGDAIGIEKVFVNGSLTVDGDGITRERPGVVLRSGAETTTSR